MTFTQQVKEVLRGSNKGDMLRASDLAGHDCKQQTRPEGVTASSGLLQNLGEGMKWKTELKNLGESES